MGEPNISYAQNGEDVVLWRALGHLSGGRYIDVGANHPTADSVSRRFYNAGWRGIAVEPNPEYASLYRHERPEDSVFEVVVSDSAAESMVLHVVDGTGLSTVVDSIGTEHEISGFTLHDITVPVRSLNSLIEEAGLVDRDIHFLSIDTEGSEASVLASIDLTRHRPWVLVIEATAPRSTRQVHDEWEAAVLDAGYVFCLFDGLSRFYVAREHADQLVANLSIPANVLDEFVPLREWELRHELGACRETAASLRAEAEQAEAERSRLFTEVTDLRTHVQNLENTISWKITAPIRKVRSLLSGSK